MEYQSKFFTGFAQTKFSKTVACLISFVYLAVWGVQDFSYADEVSTAELIGEVEPGLNHVDQG